MVRLHKFPLTPKTHLISKATFASPSLFLSLSSSLYLSVYLAFYIATFASSSLSLYLTFFSQYLFCLSLKLHNFKQYLLDLPICQVYLFNKSSFRFIGLFCIGLFMQNQIFISHLLSFYVLLLYGGSSEREKKTTFLFLLSYA